jgi:tRNA 2-thiocytidine biosynthesis protein TtcA
MTLLYDLMKRKKSFPIKYELEAVHIKTDFCTCCEKTDLEDKLKEWNVPYRIVPVPILKRLKPGKKMNCYWCSNQRRMELLKIAQAEGFTKIALGHHMDDMLETLFMNICYKGEIATMLPIFTYHKFPHTVIRPLTLVSENLIRRFAREKGILSLVCTCPYGENSKRKKIKAIIREIAGSDDSIRYTMFKAMNNININYLIPGCIRERLPEMDAKPEEPEW